MKKNWNEPAVETLDLLNTAYESKTGVVPDGYKDNDENDCWDLYES